MNPRLLVICPAAPWADWTDHRLPVIGQLTTPSDDAGHACGQWTGRVHWITAVGEDVILELEFLVARFVFEPGTKLGFFIGRRHVTDLVVKDRATPVIDKDATPLPSTSG